MLATEPTGASGSAKDILLSDIGAPPLLPPRSSQRTRRRWEHWGEDEDGGGGCDRDRDGEGCADGRCRRIAPPACGPSSEPPSLSTPTPGTLATPGEEECDDNDDGLNANTEASPPLLLSILNLIVDHYMAPPSPLEPDEFRASVTADAEAGKDCDEEDGNGDDEAEE